MRTRLAAGLLAVTAALLIGPSTGGSTPVATSAAAYQLCGRVFPDPHAYWPSPVQAPARSPFAKGNATCASVDFLSYDDMVVGRRVPRDALPAVRRVLRARARLRRRLRLHELDLERRPLLGRAAAAAASPTAASGPTSTCCA